MNDRARLLTGVIVTSVLASIAAAQSHAECVIPPPPCEALARAEVVFYGEVLDSTVISPGPFSVSRVAFKVLRAFKGVTGQQFSGTFRIASPEDFRFHKGLIVVVYTSKRDGVWVTACSRTTGRTTGHDATVLTSRQPLDREVQQLAACPQVQPARP